MSKPIHRGTIHVKLEIKLIFWCAHLKKNKFYMDIFGFQPQWVYLLSSLSKILQRERNSFDLCFRWVLALASCEFRLLFPVMSGFVVAFVGDFCWWKVPYFFSVFDRGSWEMRNLFSVLIISFWFRWIRDENSPSSGG